MVQKQIGLNINLINNLQVYRQHGQSFIIEKDLVQNCSLVCLERQALMGEIFYSCILNSLLFMRI